jgi:hypothetical protein
LLPHPAYGYINNDSYLQNRGQSTYNAMEVKLDRKFRNGLNLLLGYTWSKTFTDADSIQPYFATVLSQSGTQNPYNLKAERSVSEQDVPSNFVASYLYELPVGKGKKFLGGSNKVVDTIVGGYRLGGVLRYVSGQPIGFYGAQGVPYFDGGIRFSRAVGNSLKTSAAQSGNYNPLKFCAYGTPNCVNPCPPQLSTTCPNPTAFWSGPAFIDVNDANHRGSGAYNFGNMPRNDAEVRSTPFANEDMNLNKHFPIHESVSADLRWEVFNVFNRHVFNKPDSGVYDTNFGQINSLIDSPRSMQLELKIRY